MKNASLVLMALGFLDTSAFANRQAFKLISENANPGNGYTELGSYNKNLKKPALIALAKKEFKKSDYWKNCGPWKLIDSRRTNIEKIAELEQYEEQSTVAKDLQNLYAAKEIVAIFGAISNNNIECSLSWFNIYGTDGSVLKLHYNSGD